MIIVKRTGAVLLRDSFCGFRLIVDYGNELTIGQSSIFSCLPFAEVRDDGYFE